jgi:hypothetical protein
MATRYWVGGGSTGAWSATGNTNWGTASGTADNASVPTTGDDVIFDGAGGTGSANCTAFTTTSLNSFVQTTGYTGTFTHTAGTTLTITGNDAGSPGGAGPTFQIGANSSWTASNATTSVITVTSTTGTVTFTCNSSGSSRNIGALTLSGAATHSLGSALTGASGSPFTWSDGTFNTNNFAISFGTYPWNGSTTRTFNGGTSTITSTTPASSGVMLLHANITFNAGSTSFVISNASPTGNRTVLPVGKTFGDFTVTNVAWDDNPILISGSSLTCANLTLTNVRHFSGPSSGFNIVNATNSITFDGESYDKPSVITGGAGSGSNIAIANDWTPDSIVFVNITKSGAGTLTASNSYNTGSTTSASFIINPPSVGGGGAAGVVGS